MRRISAPISDEHDVLLAARLREDGITRTRLMQELIFLYVSGRWRWKRGGLTDAEPRSLVPHEWWPEAPEEWLDGRGNIDLDKAFAVEDRDQQPRVWTVRDVVKYCTVRYGIQLDPNTIRRFAKAHYDPPRTSSGRASWRWDEDDTDLWDLIADVQGGRVQEWSRQIIREGRRSARVRRRKEQGWEVEIAWAEDSCGSRSVAEGGPTTPQAGSTNNSRPAGSGKSASDQGK